MRWRAALVVVSLLTLGQGPANAQAVSCTGSSERPRPLRPPPLSRLPVNEQLFGLLCASSIGFSGLDPTACDLHSPRVLQLLGAEILAGAEGATPALTELTGHPGPFPFVTLVADPNDAPPGGSPAGSVSLFLSDPQEALLGCGPFYGTSCALDGIDLLNAEASALFESVLGPAGAAGGPVCARAVDGRTVILPGCRGPAQEMYDPAIDGTPPSEPHPIDRSPFGSEIAALSWNFLVALVALSGSDPGEPSAFDPADPYAPDGCSFANPGRCASVSGFFRVGETPRVGLRFGRRDFTFRLAFGRGWTRAIDLDARRSRTLREVGGGCSGTELSRSVRAGGNGRSSRTSLAAECRPGARSGGRGGCGALEPAAWK